jgi:hypothetical protein
MMSRSSSVSRSVSEFVKAVHRHSLAMLDSIVTMDKIMVCYHTPQSKKQSQQWIKKGQPGPIKVKVQASRTKQMLLAFFDSKGLIYMHIDTEGLHRQRCIHREGPRRLHEAFQEEEACDC